MNKRQEKTGSPPYPYPECKGKVTDIDFCIEKDCEHLQSVQGHQIQYCSLSLWKMEEKYGFTDKEKEEFME